MGMTNDQILSRLFECRHGQFNDLSILHYKQENKLNKLSKQGVNGK